MSRCNKPRGDRYISAGAHQLSQARQMALSNVSRPFPVGSEVMPASVAHDVVDGLSLHAGLLLPDQVFELVAALAVVTRGMSRRDAATVVCSRVAAFGATLPDCWRSLFTFHREGADHAEAG